MSGENQDVKPNPRHGVSLLGDNEPKNLAAIAKLRKFKPTDTIKIVATNIKKTVADTDAEISKESDIQKNKIIDINADQANQNTKADEIVITVTTSDTKITQISSIITDTFDKRSITTNEDLGATVLRNVLNNTTGNHLDVTRSSAFIRSAAHNLSIKWRSYVHERGLYKVVHAVANYNPISLALCHKQLYFSPALHDKVKNEDDNAKILRDEMQTSAQAILDDANKKYPKK